MTFDTCCSDVLVDISETHLLELEKYGGLYHASKTETTLNGLNIMFEQLSSYYPVF